MQMHMLYISKRFTEYQVGWVRCSATIARIVVTAERNVKGVGLP